MKTCTAMTWAIGIFCGIVFLSTRTASAQPASSAGDTSGDDAEYQFFGGVSLGTFTFPHQTEWFPNLGIDAGFTCHKNSLCDRYQLHFLRAHFDVAISNNKWLENGYTRPPEKHLPWLNFALHAAELTVGPRIRLALGHIQISRATRFLYEDVNLQINVARARFEFANIERPRVQNGCWVDLGGPGVKYVRYAAFDAVPFAGLDVMRFQQGCQIVAGTRKISGVLGYALQSDLAAGQSGNGTPAVAGGFGAIHLENRFQAQLGLQFEGASLFSRSEVSQIRLMGVVSAHNHMDAGCLQGGERAALPCGSSLMLLQYQVGVQLEFVFGASSSLRAKKGTGTPWPGFSL